MKGPARSFLWSVGVLAALAAFSVGLLSRRLVENLPVTASVKPVVVDSYLASSSKGVEIAESEYFSQLTDVLEQFYVDGVKDKLGLANGAVRGMVASLADPHSAFYNKEQMDALTRRLEGRFEGIGAEVTLEYDAAELKKLREKSRDLDALLLIPILRLTAVMPGSPAEKAGLKPGDIVTGIDGRAVLSSMDVKKLRDLQSAAAKDPAKRKELTDAREAFRKRAEDNLPAGRAREKLTTGIEGTLKIEVQRGDETIKAEASRGETKVAPLIKNPDGSYQLRFFRGLGAAFAQDGLAGKDLTLDLRNSGQGDFASLKDFLESAGPKGALGTLSTEKEGAARLLTIERGVAKPARYTLLVDSSTQGAAEIFALAMAAHGGAKLDGSRMSGSRAWIEIFATAEGSGYTLTTGIYKPQAGAAK